MAKYTYKCQACGHIYQTNRYISSEIMETGKVIHDTPECGGSYERVYQAPAISIKGTGIDNLDRRTPK